MRTSAAAFDKQQGNIAASSSGFERYLKLLYAAREKEGVGGPSNEIIAAYLEAATACPMRAEALHSAARYCRNKGLYERGYEFAAKGLAVAYPNGGLPIEDDCIYQYGLLDELAVCAYWTERYTECVSACDRLLSARKMPTDMRDRVVKNRNSGTLPSVSNKRLLPHRHRICVITYGCFERHGYEKVHVCYEAGPTGYGLYRQVRAVRSGGAHDAANFGNQGLELSEIC